MPDVKRPDWANEMLGTPEQMVEFVKGLRIRNAVGEEEFLRRVRIVEAKEAARKNPADNPPAQKP